MGLFRDKYADFTVKHFHEQLQKRHGYVLSYTVTKLTLHAAGLVLEAPKRSAHRDTFYGQSHILNDVSLTLHVTRQSHISRIRERLDSPADFLSGGEQQMLAVARALSGDVRVLLLDESFEGPAPPWSSSCSRPSIDCARKSS